MGEAAQYAIKMHHVTKTFGKVVANKNVDLELKTGEILALLGENGSGKTTWMNMLSGIYFPDYGEIYVKGKEVTIRSPKDSFTLGIGMIHQHFKLVDVFSAMDNVVIGAEGKRIKPRELKEKILELTKKFGLEVDPEKKIYNMSVSEKQTVEILKVLYRNADILILDEPTAVLTPQETQKLFAILRRMKEQGSAIIIITHKLNEVMEISDRVTILRKGKSIDTVNTAETNEKQLTELMVGRPVTLEIDRPKCENVHTRLKVVDLSVKKADGTMALKDLSFEIKAGEILGVAGIAGSGQKELCEAIAGLRPIQSGLMIHKGDNIVGLPPKAILEKGISMSFIPEDRLGMGLAPSMSITDNMILKNYGETKGPFVDRKAGRTAAQQVIEQLGVVTPSTETPVRRLSGGRSDHRGADPDRADRAPPAHQAGGAGAGYQPGAAGRGTLHPEDAPWRIDGRSASATAAAVIPGMTGWPWSSASAAFSRRRSSSPPRPG